MTAPDFKLSSSSLMDWSSELFCHLACRAGPTRPPPLGDRALTDKPVSGVSGTDWNSDSSISNSDSSISSRYAFCGDKLSSGLDSEVDVSLAKQRGRNFLSLWSAVL